MNVTSKTFSKLGNIYTKSSLTRSETIALRRFKSFFGVTPSVCLIIWKKLTSNLPVDAEPKHLLWSLSFLKQYCDEHNTRSIFRCDEKTIRKWTWVFVSLLSNMNVVKLFLQILLRHVCIIIYSSQILWENRFHGSAVGQTCFCSLDGVDFRIKEPKPFNRLWYSHKFKGPGLMYEIGLNIRTGNIVWANGGYPCGKYPDLKLARESYLWSINEGEKTIADKGYNDDKFFILPNETNNSFHKLIMSRHETVNKRMRQFQILKKEFRNNRRKHPMVFHAVANITQLVLENGEPLFSVFQNE